MAVPLLRDVVGVLDSRYPPSWAEDWDVVGPTCGDLDQPVRSVLLAVDCTPAVVDEAVDRGVDLLLTHHPLLLRPVSSVATTTAKGAMIHRLVRSGIALFTAHTNADRARPGVSDALADALGLIDVVPIDPRPTDPLDKIVVFVPLGHDQAVLEAMADAGAGTIGDYSRCAWTTTGMGTFRPGDGARPHTGEVGRVETVEEIRVEMVLPRHRRDDVVAAMRRSHPYEEPAFDVLELAAWSSSAGLGRWGRLPEPEPLHRFVQRVAAALPVGESGVKATGADPDRSVAAVAVCGGAGSSLLDAVRRLPVDAYVTADLSHHRAGEFADTVGPDGPVLIDATHYGTERPWLDLAARLLRDDLAERGTSVAVAVSTVPTDPWRRHASTP